jgi:hypothetical protein
VKRYLAILAATVLVIVAGVAGLAWLVDPYTYWNAPVIEGVNRYRPAAGKHMLPVKLRQYERMQPNTLVAGNSRVYVGIDPESSVWPSEMQPVYNLGLPSVGMRNLVQAVETALFTHQPRALFVGLDFINFTVEKADWRKGGPVVLPPRPDITERAALAAKLLLSLDALTDTAGALVEQHSASPETLTPAGFYGIGKYPAIIAEEGHAGLFRQRNRENLEYYLAGPKRVRWGPEQNPEFDALEDLVQTAKTRRIALTLFTYPYHADLLLSFQKAGLWPAYEDWLRDLAAFSARTGILTYMFTRVDEVTGEAVPEDGDTKTQMRWYWEAGHFKPALGDRMVLIMNTSLDDRLVLTPDNVEARIGELRDGLAAYGEQHPEAVRRIDAAFEDAAR